jgi:GntR family transcriptional regulator/MocR family aminotransferase
MLGITIDKSGSLPIKRQIFQSLKESITNGRLTGGEALPSTRTLAQALGVSRNTVCEAYDMLIAEGYLKSRQGAATRVAHGLDMGQAKSETTGLPAESEKSVRPSRVWRADFKTGQPDLDAFPKFSFEQSLREGMAAMPVSALGYTGQQGLYELRAQIASWLFRSRGITADAGDIFITSGATHALHLAAELLEPVKRIQVEDPCHSEMRKMFADMGYEVIPVPVDEHGMRTGLLRDTTAAVYATPSHQFPLGGILPAQRRAELIRYARERDAYIIEDDYDSEFRYAGDPVTPLYSLEPSRVIYVGTLSKTLFPALRIGYVILPRAFHSQWRTLRMRMDIQNPPYEQYALLRFFNTRKIDRHIQRMRRLYGERRRALQESLTEAFGSGWRPWGDSAGLHLAAEFSGREFKEDFTSKASQQGIRIATVEQHCMQKGLHADKLLIGYGHLKPDMIRNGVMLLKEFIEQY